MSTGRYEPQTREMMWRKLNNLIRYRGTCGFCGFHDARHRLFDVIIYSNDTDYELAQNLELPIETIKLIRKLKPYA
jgi:hypothetical protein